MVGGEKAGEEDPDRDLEEDGGRVSVAGFPRCRVEDVAAAECLPENGSGIRDQFVLHSVKPSPLGESKAVDVSVQTYLPGGEHYRHKHSSLEQVYYVLSGCGEVEVEGAVSPVRGGDFVYIAPNRTHATKNTGPDPLKVLLVSVNVSSASVLEHLLSKK